MSTKVPRYEYEGLYGSIFGDALIKLGGSGPCVLLLTVSAAKVYSRDFCVRIMVTCPNDLLFFFFWLGREGFAGQT